MESKKIKFEYLSKFGTIIRGVRINEKERQSKLINVEKVKVLNWPNLKKFIECKTLDDAPSYAVDLKRKYNQGDMYVHAGDIVFLTVPTHNGQDVMYVENEPPEKCIYNETVFVFRVKDDEFSEYAYMLLKCGLYKNYISEINIGYGKRLTPMDIMNIKLPILNGKVARQLFDEYLSIKKLHEELKKKNETFEKKVNKLTIDKN